MRPSQYLQQCREKSKLSQAELARAIDVHPQAVSQWERGVAPIPKHQILPLRKAAGVNGTVLVDLMTAEYRARLVAAIKKGAKK